MSCQFNVDERRLFVAQCEFLLWDTNLSFTPCDDYVPIKPFDVSVPMKPFDDYVPIKPFVVSVPMNIR